jgi:hypothetical protein
MPFLMDMLDGVDAFLNMFEYTYDNSNTHNTLAMSVKSMNMVPP